MKGIIEKLRTDASAGIHGDEDEVARRKQHFGSNYVEPEPPESILQMAWNALQDPCLIFLCFAACVSFFVGIVFDQGLEWLEGVAILCAVFVVVTVSAVNDYQKEKQFRELSVVNDNISVTVIRDGAKNKVQTRLLAARQPPTLAVRWRGVRRMLSAAPSAGFDARRGSRRRRAPLNRRHGVRRRHSVPR